jgi:hypothetical protein
VIKDGDGSLHVEGGATGSFTPGAGTIDNDTWDTSGTDLAASNQQHYHPLQPKQLGTASADTIWAWTVLGATGTIAKISVTNLTACAGSSTVSVDVQKNSVTVLSSVVTLNAATGDAGASSGTEAGLLDGAQTSLVAGDVITVVITPNQSGTDALASDIGVAIGVTEDHPA